MRINTTAIRRIERFLDDRREEFTVHPLGDTNEYRRFCTLNPGKIRVPFVSASETSLELGAPPADSFGTVLWSPSSIDPSGSLWIQEISGIGKRLTASYFHLVLLTMPGKADVARYDPYRRSYCTAMIPGLMSRVMAGRIWIRISRSLSKKGFSLYSMGQCIYGAFHAAPPHPLSMRIVLAAGNDRIIKDFKKMSLITKTAKGRMDCDVGTCDICEEKIPCGRIKNNITGGK